MDDRASRHQRIVEPDDDIIGLTRRVELHPHHRQLGEADGKIVVGPGKIGVPAGAAVLAAVAREVGAAEVERSVEVLGLRPFRRRAPEASASHPDLLPDCSGRRQDDGDQGR